MNRRTQVLAAVAILAGGAFVADRLFTSLWWAPWKELGAQIDAADGDLYAAEAVVRRGPAAREGWKKIRRLLAAERGPDVQNHFSAHLDAICDRVGVTPDIQGGSPQQRGEFREYSYDLRLRLTWEQMVELLRQFHDSREFLKPVRVNVASQYEKDRHLDLDVRLSTIEYAPVAARERGR